VLEFEMISVLIFFLLYILACLHIYKTSGLFGGPIMIQPIRVI